MRSARGLLGEECVGFVVAGEVEPGGCLCRHMPILAPDAFSANLLLSDALRPSGATFSLLGWRWEEGRSPNVWPSPCGRAPPARYAGTVSALAPFSPTVRRWFEQTFDAPTPAQERGLARDCVRQAHAHPGADGLGEDARGLPLGARPRAAQGGHPGALR
jgi:hypothetical protein